MEDWKRYTKFYKGEEENPYSSEDRRAFWWDQESYYFPYINEYKDKERWETGDMYQLCLETFPSIRIFLKKQPPITRGFLSKLALDSYSHSFNDVTFIKEYTKL